MTTRRRFVLVSGVAAISLPFGSIAQQLVKFARIGFLGAATAAAWAKEVEALRAGLRDAGYAEGRNLAIEFRWAEGNYGRFPELVTELIAQKVDVVVTHATPGTLAAKRATTTVPIVVAHVGDAVATGVVPSLSRHGGNITGTTFFSPELSAKRLELLKEAAPRMARVAVLLNPGTPINGPDLEAMARTAKPLGLELQQYEVRAPADFADAFAAMVGKRVDAVIVTQDGMLNANTRAVAEFANRHRLPSVGFKQLAEAGGMIGYGVDFIEVYRRVAYFIDRILKGTKVADIPFEQPTRFELVLNRNAARALGIAFPQQLLLRADKVIE